MSLKLPLTAAPSKPPKPPTLRLGARAQFLLALIVTLALPLLLQSGSLATEVLIYALAVAGCNLLLGYTGLLSFGQGIFFGLGSYTVGILLTRWAALPMPVALLCAMLIGALAAVLVGGFAIRQRGTYFVMLTLAFSQLFYFLAYSLPDLTGGDNGLLDIPRPALSIAGWRLMTIDTPWRFYAFVAVCFLVVFALLLRITHSVFGHTLLALRDNEARAAAVGYDVRRFKLMAFAISGAVTGLAGAFLAMMTGIAPLSSIAYQSSEMILIMTVIGGSGNLCASLLGAIFYVLFSDWVSTLWPRWLLILGLALIAVSLFMQKGLWGLGERIGFGLAQRLGWNGETKQATQPRLATQPSNRHDAANTADRLNTSNASEASNALNTSSATDAAKTSVESETKA